MSKFSRKILLENFREPFKVFYLEFSGNGLLDSTPTGGKRVEVKVEIIPFYLKDRFDRRFGDYLNNYSLTKSEINDFLSKNL